MSNIVYKDKNLVVILKSPGVSSQPDHTSGQDALAQTRNNLKELNEASDIYPVHRLDKVVGGLLVFARNKRTAAALSSHIADGELNKEYIAVVEGDPKEGTMEDYLIKNSAIAKAIPACEGDVGAKYAELKYKTLETSVGEKGERSLVKIILKTGRFHQIRAQFSSRGYPILGDKKYGSKDHRAKTPALFSNRLSFLLDGKAVSCGSLPDLKAYPWNLFDPVIYEEV